MSAGVEIAAARAAAAMEDGDDGDIAFACETDFDTDGPSVPYGAYAAVVEVDAETGAVDLQRIVSVDDAGSMINETIVRGQVHGGIGQAIGQALYEEFVYDADGNPITANFMDYCIPGPDRDAELRNTSHRNSLAQQPPRGEGDRRIRNHRGGPCDPERRSLTRCPTSESVTSISQSPQNECGWPLGK